MPSSLCILRVAVQTPLRRWFDYLPPDNYNIKLLAPGQRLRVPFGKGKERIGLLLAIVDKSDIPTHKLKKVSTIIDHSPLFPQKHLKLLEWASNYYQHPIGDVVFSTLPTLLRQGNLAKIKQELQWRLKNNDFSLLNNAPKQKAILEFLHKYPDGVSRVLLNKNFLNWQTPLKNLIDKNYVESFTVIKKDGSQPINNPVNLNKSQENAVDKLIKAWGSYQAFLLNGVTGSGKTEIYLQCIEHAINADQQVLILLPEIGLTPQFVKRIKDRINTNTVVMHSALSDQKRLNAWLMARDGEAKIILGTRSAIWVPLNNPGIIIVDEEHDLSFKQQDGFRYSARDMALTRGQHENIPVILGSATPAMESLRNVVIKRYVELKLPERAGNASLPAIKILDIRRNEMLGAFSKPLLEKITFCLNHKQQVLLFHNRRGYAPVMMCHVCGHVLQCPRCDIQLTYHKYKNKLCCHQCGHEEILKSSCPDCLSNQIIEIGYGTERLVDTLNKYFPQASILRIDRDTTRRKNSMRTMLDVIQTGNADILVGTQMLAKGHHFPNVTLVGIVDADRGLFSADYRASERMAQIITQVSGRAGRAAQPGTVIIQTHHPEHPLLTTLVTENYDKFAESVLLERKQAELPPFSFHALLRAEANESKIANKFLCDAKTTMLNLNHQELKLFGPLPAPIEKRAGRFRLQLLIQANERNTLRQILGPWVLMLEELKSSRKVRWSLDVDPQDTV
jgi:primosomal protein N' (replication factor Y)